MDRREYFALVGSGLTLAVSGCTGDGENGDDNTEGRTGDDRSSGDGGDSGTGNTTGGDNSDNGGTDDDGEDEPEDIGAPAEWTNWLAAETITGRGEIEILGVDLQKVRDHLPSFYASLNVEQISNTYEVAEQSLNQLISIQEDGTEIQFVVTGEFSTEDFLSAAEENGSIPDEQYAGYDIFRNQDDTDLALDDGVILAANSVQEAIDAERGQSQRVTETDTDWNTMLSSLGNSPVAVAETGIPDLDLSLAPELSAYTVTNIQDVNVDVTYRFQYTDEQTATTAVESDEKELKSYIAQDGVVNETNQRGARVLIKGQVPKEEFESNGEPADSNDTDNELETVSFILNPVQANINIALQYEPFVEYINNNTDATVETQRAASYTATIQEIRRGSGDLADTGPFGAVAAKDVVDVVGIRKAFGAEKYFSLLTTRADSNINQLSDIKGEQIALGSRLSTSGTLFPLKMLKDAGLDIGDAPQGSANDFTVAGYTDHSTARDQLINRPEIVAAGTGAFSTAPHVPKSQFDQMSEQFVDISPDYEDAGTTSPQLDLLSVSQPIPRAPIVARSDWSGSTRDTVEDVMLNAPDQAFKHDPAALAEELGVSQDSQKFEDHQIWFSDVIDASFDDFSSVERVLNDLNVEPAELG